MCLLCTSHLTITLFSQCWVSETITVNVWSYAGCGTVQNLNTKLHLCSIRLQLCLKCCSILALYLKITHGPLGHMGHTWERLLKSSPCYHWSGSFSFYHFIYKKKKVKMVDLSTILHL